MTTAGLTMIDAYEYVTRGGNGAAINPIPLGGRLTTESGWILIVRESNGFIQSGKWQHGQPEWGVLDLRVFPAWLEIGGTDDFPTDLA